MLWLLFALNLPQARAARFMPVFPIDEGDTPTQEPVPVTDTKILVFPHIGTYFKPQMPETQIDRVTLRSDARCALSDLSAKDKPFKRESELFFDLSSAQLPKFVHCSKPTTVVREAGLKSYAYSGDFIVRSMQNPRPHLEVINVLPFETYIKGVVPGEMPHSWPLEALKAQAVAARTYGYYELLKARIVNPDQGYDMDDTVFFQAYVGVTEQTKQTDQAVDETRDEVMAFQGGIIKAWFSDDNGGMTETALNAFGFDFPYTIQKHDPTGLEWIQKPALTFGAVTQKLRDKGHLTNVQEARSIEVSERFSGGRAKSVQLELSDGSVKELTAFDFRLATGLKSTWFFTGESGDLGKISGQPGDIAPFHGRGWGHGVGLSQEGARAKAAAGSAEDYHSILDFYFDGIRFCLYASCSSR